MRLIGMTGRKRSGKDTVGAYLRMEHGFAVESFACPLKEAVRYIYGWDHRHVDGDLKEVFDPYWQTTPRAVLQTFGTEIGRQLDPEVWVKSLKRRLESHQAGPGGPFSFVITDVRFPNEADVVKALGGEIWRVVRPALGERTDLHASETGMDDYVVDRELVNSGSIADLHDQVDVLLQGMNADSKG